MRLKIGAVSYLNSKPLVEGMEGTPADDFEVGFDLPSRLADRLAGEELDVALIPVIEAIVNPDYTIVSNACIACHGPVWSVKLMSRVPGSEIKTVALDEGSRTSCALTRVLLDRKFGVQPECVPLTIDQDWTTAETDAVLIIGDRAMKATDPEFPWVWDLGETWNQWTGKPFVFAVWAARPGSDLERLKSILTRSRDLGLKNIDKISTEHAANYGLSKNECLKYLGEHLHFVLGDKEKSGMNLFFKYAAELSLIPQLTQLQFHDCQTNSQPTSPTA